MELLSEPTWRDRFHYLIGYLLTAICGALGLLAAHNIRNTILFLATLGEFRRRGFRIADRAGWFVLGVAWLGYMIVVEASHRKGVTRARIQKARGQELPKRFEERALLRSLWRHDLHLVVPRFLSNLLIPLAILIVVLIINEILQSMIVT
jgi:hypothetical protein